MEDDEFEDYEFENYELIDLDTASKVGLRERNDQTEVLAEHDTTPRTDLEARDIAREVYQELEGTDQEPDVVRAVIEAKTETARNENGKGFVEKMSSYYSERASYTADELVGMLE